MRGLYPLCRELFVVLHAVQVLQRSIVGRVGGGGVTENGVPPSGSTRTVVGQSVAGRAPGVVRSKWRE